jgi:hypothetical protein
VKINSCTRAQQSPHDANQDHARSYFCGDAIRWIKIHPYGNDGTPRACLIVLSAASGVDGARCSSVLRVPSFETARVPFVRMAAKMTKMLSNALSTLAETTVRNTSTPFYHLC